MRTGRRCCVCDSRKLLTGDKLVSIGEGDRVAHVGCWRRGPVARFQEVKQQLDAANAMTVTLEEQLRQRDQELEAAKLQNAELQQQHANAMAAGNDEGSPDPTAVANTVKEQLVELVRLKNTEDDKMNGDDACKVCGLAINGEATCVLRGRYSPHLVHLACYLDPALEAANARANAAEQLVRLKTEELVTMKHQVAQARGTNTPSPTTARTRAQQLQRRVTELREQKEKLLAEEKALLEDELPEANRFADHEEAEADARAWARVLGLAAASSGVQLWVKQTCRSVPTGNSSRVASEFTYVLESGEELVLSLRHDPQVTGTQRLAEAWSRA
jgi:hypothetical protein